MHLRDETSRKAGALVVIMGKGIQPKVSLSVLVLCRVTTINPRDIGWETVHAKGLETVAAISIDDTWSGCVLDPLIPNSGKG